VVYEPITTATRALAPENIPKQIVTSLRNAIKGITQSFLSLSPLYRMNMAKELNLFLTVSIPQPLRPHHQTK
jgi:hypothetical protein